MDAPGRLVGDRAFSHGGGGRMGLVDPAIGNHQGGAERMRVELAVFHRDRLGHRQHHFAGIGSRLDGGFDAIDGHYRHLAGRDDDLSAVGNGQPVIARGLVETDVGGPAGPGNPEGGRQQQAQRRGSFLAHISPVFLWGEHAGGAPIHQTDRMDRRYRRLR